MPSAQQVAYHFSLEEERRRNAEEAAARDQAARMDQASGIQRSQMDQQAKLQQDRDFLLASYQAQQKETDAYRQQQQQQAAIVGQGQLAQQHFGHQAMLAEQQAGHAWNSNIQQTDLAAQLNQVKLTQSEQMEAGRVRDAVAKVNSNPDLSREEKQMLVTQLETKLNPLENRQRQSQMLFQQIQTQGLAQQNEQQATLFNQHQAQIARGVQGNIQYAEVQGPDGQTYRQPYFVDSKGNIQEMSFPMLQQQHAMRMAQGEVGIAGDIQSLNQRTQLFPGQMQLQQHSIRHAGLSNENLAQEMQHLGNMRPLQVQSLRAEIDHRRQTIAGQIQDQRIRGDLADPQLEQAYRQLDLMNAHMQQYDAATDHTRQQTEDLRYRASPPQRAAQEQIQRLTIDHLSGSNRLQGTQADQLETNLYGAPRAAIEAAVDRHLAENQDQHGNNEQPVNRQDLIERELNSRLGNQLNRGRLDSALEHNRTAVQHEWATFQRAYDQHESFMAGLSQADRAALATNSERGQALRNSAHSTPPAAPTWARSYGANGAPMNFNPNVMNGQALMAAELSRRMDQTRAEMLRSSGRTGGAGLQTVPTVPAATDAPAAAPQGAAPAQGGVRAAMADAGLPPNAAPPVQRPANDWRNLSAAQIDARLTSEQRRRWHRTASPWEGEFWTSPGGSGPARSAERDAIWAEANR